MPHRTLHRAALVLALLLVASSGRAQDGILDPAFSTDGRQTAAFANPPGNDDSARSVAVQPDGKLVIVGSACSAGPDCLVAVARFLPNGAPDPGFDSDGERLVIFVAPSGSHQGVKVLVRPQDGKLVIVGRQLEGDFFSPLLGLARLLTNGAFDPTFGFQSSPGSITHTIPGGEINQITAAALTSSGRILVGGHGLQTGGSGDDCFVARFLENGELDTAFGDNGVAWIAFDQGQANYDALQDLAVQADGRIVVLAQISDSGHPSDADTGIARLVAGGTLDTSFDGDTGTGNGKVIFQLTDFGGSTVDSPKSLAIQSDGRILFSGFNDLIGTGDSRWYFGRLLSDGSTDLTLAARFPAITTPSGELGGDILVQSDSKLLISGYTLEGDCLAIRYDPEDDNFDASFGTAGLEAFRGEFLVGVRCYASALAGGKLVVAGSTASATDDDFFVARLKSSLIFSDGFESGSKGQWSL